MHVSGIPAGGSSGFIRPASTVIPWIEVFFYPVSITATAVTAGTVEMIKILKNLKSNKSGASAAEYALIVAVLGGLVVAGANAFGGSLSTAMTSAGTALEGQSDGDFNAAK
ncbi:hypothetical protein CAP39_04830 [Sphingomonas sp. IBVSS1]|uniref:Flp family type IVb pilin n=2 Tax=Sandarakinorhabdus cyanobacteriorum TaxID=1981098 RepID=A0A255Y8T6_9SPHN|nr:hypothetical protein CAP39_04830 [Sphingomonas sp. IBVSS1]OYQ25647.1 Flp family type IVb pilin [Sandarakinorhabdus cyanobacteriorum]